MLEISARTMSQRVESSEVSRHYVRRNQRSRDIPCHVV
jgi:hypothetical protein